MTPDHDSAELGQLTVQGTTYQTALTKKFLHRQRWSPKDPRMVTCVIPGIILKIQVRQGSIVHDGDPLLVLEAMKMQNNIAAPIEGKVKKVLVHVGDQVTKGQLLVELE